MFVDSIVNISKHVMKELLEKTGRELQSARFGSENYLLNLLSSVVECCKHRTQEEKVTERTNAAIEMERACCAIPTLYFSNADQLRSMSAAKSAPSQASIEPMLALRLGYIQLLALTQCAFLLHLLPKYFYIGIVFV